MAQLQPFVLVRNSTKPLKIFSPVFTRYSLPPRLWSLQTSLDPNRGKVSVEPAAGSNPGPDCRRPAGPGSHTREISVAISNSHIITHKAPLLMLWRGRGGPWRTARLTADLDSVMTGVISAGALCKMHFVVPLLWRREQCDRIHCSWCNTVPCRDCAAAPPDVCAF